MTDEVIHHYNFYLSSQHRDSGTPSSPTFYLNRVITLNNYVPSRFECYFDRVQIPFSYSQFNTVAANTTLQFTFYRGSSTYPGLSATIAQGNYNVLTCAQAVVDSLTAAIVAAVPAYTPVLTYEYDGDANHLRFSLADDGTPSAAVITVATFSGLSLALGFTANWGIDSTLPYVESTQDCNMSPSRCLYIRSTSLYQKNSYEAITSTVENSDILAMIPIEVSPLSYITWNPRNVIRTELINNSISEIQFFLSDEQGNSLQEMDLSWSMHFVLEEVKVEAASIDHIGRLSREPAKLNAQGQPQLTPDEQQILEEYRQEELDALKALKEQEERRLERYRAKLEKKRKNISSIK